MSITPTMWQRMPWHPKARAIAALEREETRLLKRIAELRAQLDEVATLTLAHRKQLSQNAHAAFARGEREQWVIIGERAYQRERGRRRRAAAREAS